MRSKVLTCINMLTCWYRTDKIHSSFCPAGHVCPWTNTSARQSVFPRSPWQLHWRYCFNIGPGVNTADLCYCTQTFSIARCHGVQTYCFILWQHCFSFHFLVLHHNQLLTRAFDWRDWPASFTSLSSTIWWCIQKFPDWVDNELKNNNKHSLRSNTKGYGNKLVTLTHKIVIKLHLEAERCTNSSSRSGWPVRNFWIHPRNAVSTNFMKQRQREAYSPLCCQKTNRIYKTLSFITVFTTARHWYLPWARRIQWTAFYTLFLRGSS
jgi:hypothetical protein